MGIPRLTKSLCGCGLETGSMIIAWLGVIGTALEILLGMIFYGVMMDALEKKLKEDNTNPDNFENNLAIIKVGAALVFVILLFGLTISLLLLIGIYKRNHCLMTPWVVLSGINCALGIILCGFQLIGSFMRPDLFVSTIIQGLVTAFGVYLFLIVYSFYCEVKEQHRINDSRFKNLGA